MVKVLVRYGRNQHFKDTNGQTVLKYLWGKGFSVHRNPPFRLALRWFQAEASLSFHFVSELHGLSVMRGEGLSTIPLYNSF